MPGSSGLTSQHSQLASHAIDVLFHPTAHHPAGDCPLHPPTELEMDAAGIACALVSQCKKSSCERQWLCMDTRLPDVLHYTESSPRYIGLAGYNPFDIAESLREIELAVATHGFRGVYLAASFNLPLADARMYPLYAKAAELAVPVLVQLSITREPRDLEHDLARLASDFSELSLVLAQPRPRLADLQAVANEFENVFFALDAGALAHWKQESPARDRDQQNAGWSALALERDYINFSGILQERCMWGSNGIDWVDALGAADLLSLAPPLSLPSVERHGGESCSVRAKFLHRNAARVFGLDQPPAARKPHSIITEIAAAER